MVTSIRIPSLTCHYHFNSWWMTYLICACPCTCVCAHTHVYLSTQPVLETTMICAGQLQVYLIQNKCHLSYLKNCILCKKRQLHSYVNDQRTMFIPL
jgi:hypothetical protein